MKIGFTGSQQGMTSEQSRSLINILQAFGSGEFHHGLCVGADAVAHKEAYRLGWDIVGHPPADTRKMAVFVMTEFKELYQPAPFLKRNSDIVQATKLLVATPNTFYEILRSGTWSTVRRARLHQRLIYVIQPNGVIINDNNNSVVEMISELVRKSGGADEKHNNY